MKDSRAQNLRSAKRTGQIHFRTRDVANRNDLAGISGLQVPLNETDIVLIGVYVEQLL